MPEGTPACEDCGLKFDRLALATNGDAKRKKLRGDRSFIVSTTKLPSDVSYIKLLLFTIFLGVFGGHCYYTGRYLRGAILTTNFVVMMSFVIFNGFFVSIPHFLDITMPICGLILFVWVFDLIKVCCKKFKVPVAIDLDTRGEQ